MAVNVTHIVATHGHGDHWFTAGVLADRFDAPVVASPGTIEQMHNNVVGREAVWDPGYPGHIPPSPVTATIVTDNRFTLEGHDLVIVEVGHSDTDDSTVSMYPTSASSSPVMSCTTAPTSTSPSQRTAGATPGAMPSRGSGLCAHG
jgi:hypothetical protein